MRFIQASLFLVLGIFILSFNHTTAEVPLPPKEKENTFRPKLMEMRTSKEVKPEDKAKSKANQDAFKNCAQYMVYMVSTPEYNGEKADSAYDINTFMSSIVEQYIMTFPGNDKQKLEAYNYDYSELLGKEVAAAVLVVLKESNRPIEKVNAMRVLTVMARAPQATIYDAVMEVITNDKYDDSLKLFAFQAASSMLDHSDYVDASKMLLKDPVKQGALCDALIKYIIKDRNPATEREAKVIQFVRLQAIVALGKFRNGVIRKPNGELVSRPAWGLLRVAAYDPNATPGFTRQEMFEAAVGLMKMKIDPETNVELQQYYINIGIKFFFEDLATDRSRLDKTPGPTYLPWGKMAVHANKALAAYLAEGKKLTNKTYADKVEKWVAAIAPSMKSVEDNILKADVKTEKMLEWSTNDGPGYPTIWKTTNAPAKVFESDPSTTLPIFKAQPVPPKK